MHIDPVWAPVVAALGASFLTISGTFGLAQWQRWRDGRASGKNARQAVYGEFHARIFSFARRVESLGLTKQLRSGIDEGISVVTRQRKPLDLFALYDWVDVEFKPLNDAYSKICAMGSQEAVDVAARLLSTCGELTNYAIATDEQRGYLIKLIRGEVQTDEQKSDYQKCLVTLFKENEKLARLIRKETGRPAAIFPIERRELAAVEGPADKTPELPDGK
jgi:hypothetical protein